MAGLLAWIARSGVVQGAIVGATLAFLTAVVVLDLVARAITTTDGGWRTIRRVGRPDNGLLVRAACAKALPAVNVLEEAAYWTTTRDRSGRRLTGRHAYLMHVPPGQLPPVDAFWSLTVTDVVGYRVAAPGSRSNVDDRSDLLRNADGSIDLLFRHGAPVPGEQNRLSIPAGRFKLTLRAYLPGPAILEGRYRVPPVARAR